MRQRPTHLPIRGYVVRARPVLSLSDVGQPSAYLTACLYKQLNGPNVDEHAAWGKNNWEDRRAGPHGISDKCASHAYHYAYERYLLPLRDAFVQGLTAKVLEVGLGCGQKNVGAGVRMWDQLFANEAGRQLELHVMVRPVAPAPPVERACRISDAVMRVAAGIQRSLRARVATALERELPQRKPDRLCRRPVVAC